ncbi:hypothetical protein A3D03_04765 [Candidatus Gottesmanbacteria bacterium RIFCSPHIGHO2_02_FULL_40_13]|uniref:CxxC-x17-CxxC domain-containing protein n=1 Tax=Candidatus Gottesmanbacteria bacterium RIFCSPHIGHO2_02_FULL_40_13 TaxID=1798384 RepID=A0A1F6A9U1_9BACT|nr:MAG: hypothetical protein A3D03_04765 [Candidatus Gottesmanbacteria bacterium RIFCSPHIGHO2_02_FULL_40_13]
MGNFNRDNRSGGGRNFGRRSFGGGGDRDGMRPSMHKAVCAECGRDCEVPFMPSGDRPIYCSNCFEKRRNEDGNSSDSGRRNFSRPNFDNRRSFSGGGNRDNVRPPSDNGQLADQLKSINFKLDKILGVLEPKITHPPVAEKEAIVFGIEPFKDKPLAVKNQETVIVKLPKVKKTKPPKKVKDEQVKTEISLE